MLEFVRQWREGRRVGFNLESNINMISNCNIKQKYMIVLFPFFNCQLGNVQTRTHTWKLSSPAVHVL